jgi:hypothetical protein
MKRVIFLSGPPKAGKSRLRGDIYRHLLFSGRKSWFVQAFSPDMEGQWVNDAHALGNGERAEEIARRQKNKIKAAGEFFSPRFVKAMKHQLAGLVHAFDLVVADLGGFPSQENREIISVTLGRQNVSPLAVVLLNNGDDGGWGEFWQSLKVEYVAYTYSADIANKII